MPFSVSKLVLLLRGRSGKTKVMIIETFEDARPGKRDLGRWRKATRNYYRAEFTRLVRQQRFY